MTSSALTPGAISAVTGAASGIGRALALALARDGVTLALADVDGDGLEQVVRRVRAAGGTVEGTVADVTRAAEMDAWAAATAGRLGAVEAVWAVAGIIDAGSVLDSTHQDIAAVVDADFWGVVHTVRAFLPAVVPARGAVVTRTSPERAAQIILRGVRAGRPRVLVGADARVADLLTRLTGTGYERFADVAARWGNVHR